jgi:tetratricopeptide (TPR) repeat protein
MSKPEVITRKDMKEPDKFQQAATQAATWIAARRRHVVLAGAAVVGVVVLLAIMDAVRAGRDERASAAANQLLQTMSATVSSVPLPGAPGPLFPTDEARQRAVVAVAEKLVAEHGGTGAAQLALLALGDAHARLGEWEPARSAYDRFLAAAPKDDSLRFGALEGLALAAEAKGGPDAALQAWERVGREAPAFSDRADLERARVLAAQGKGKDAKELLASFGEKHKDSLLSGEASERLARLGGK